jgi:hypothetical protein
MNFAYEGFTQDHDRRCFTFRGMEDYHPVSVFSIELDLPLLAQNQISVQEAPLFCLQLLTTALRAGPSFLEKLQHYRVLAEDLRPLLLERERQAAEKALKKASYRPFRKPASTSQISLTVPISGR